MKNPYSSVRAAFLLVIIPTLLSCGGGGSGGGGGTAPITAPAPTTVSGAVTAPGGVIAFNKRPSFGDLFESEAYAALTGLVIVPDNTIIELARLNTNASGFTVITSTATSGGRYSFNLTALGLSPAHDLIVRVAGSGGKEMRAFVVGTIADLSPVSEAAYQLAVQSLNGEPLSNLTLQEVTDITGAVDLVAALQSIGIATSLDQAVSLVKNEVGSNDQVKAFITAAAGNGQTTEGTGDVGNFAPMEQSNTWRYQSTIAVSGQPSRFFDHTLLISGQEPDPIYNVNTTVISDTNAEGENRTEKSYRVRSLTGVVSYGNDDPDDHLTRGIGPIKTIHFPLTIGSSIMLGEKPGIDWGDDIDGDNQNELVSVSLYQNVFGFESITVGAGNFPLSLRVEQTTLFAISLTGGGTLNVIQKDLSWLASGVGLVKSETVVELEEGGRIGSSTEDLMAYVVSGQGGGARIELGDGNLGPGSPLNLRLENTRQLFGALYDQSNRLIPGVPFTYSSTNPQVVSVDPQGVATALSPGTATITATLGNVVSNGVPITVGDVRVVSLASKDLVYDPISRRIYVSVPNRASSLANTVTVIDPISGQIGASLFVGMDPGKLAVSDDGQFLYVGLNGEGTVRRINLSSFTLGPTFALGSPSCGQVSKVGDMEVISGNPLMVAILKVRDCSPAPESIEIYDNGIRRPAIVPTTTIAAIERSQQSPNKLFGVETGTFAHFVEMSVSSSGVIVSNQSAEREDYFATDLKYDSGRLFTQSMRIVDATTLADIGQIQHQDIIHGGMVVPDLARSRIFVIPDAASLKVLGFDSTSLQPVGSIAIEHNLDSATFGLFESSFIRWGIDGLAFRTGFSPVFDHPADRDLVVLVRTSAIQ